MRKKVEGEIRNKDRTKEKLIKAVGIILIEEGYSKLGVNNIARKALVDKKLIYRYFGSLEELLSSYFRRKDFWVQLSESVFENVDIEFNDFGKNIAIISLINLLDSLDSQEEMRKVLLWEISERNNDSLNKLRYERELLAKDFFYKVNPLFENSKIDIQSCYAILLAGVYYLSLHSTATGGNFCDIDINKKDGRNRVKKSISDILDLIYSVPNSDNK